MSLRGEPERRRSVFRRVGRGRSDQTPLLALGGVAFAVGAVVAVVVVTALITWMLSD